MHRVLSHNKTRSIPAGAVYILAPRCRGIACLERRILYFFAGLADYPRTGASSAARVHCLQHGHLREHHRPLTLG